MAVPLVPRGLKLLSVPPVTLMSASAKLVLGSLKVKVMVSVPPVVKLPVPARAMAMVGGVLSGWVVS